MHAGKFRRASVRVPRGTTTTALLGKQVSRVSVRAESLDRSAEMHRSHPGNPRIAWSQRQGVHIFMLFKISCMHIGLQYAQQIPHALLALICHDISMTWISACSVSLASCSISSPHRSRHVKFASQEPLTWYSKVWSSDKALLLRVPRF